MDRAAFLAAWERFNRIVHDIVAGLGGSIAAEHGVGLLKRDELARYADPVALDLMRSLKAALDPGNILNPGKVLNPGKFSTGQFRPTGAGAAASCGVSEASTKI